MKICIQSGHWNKPGGGAPNEQATNKRITDRLATVLRDRGFEIYQTDWFANNDLMVTKVDYSLFIALHCDMDYPADGGSGFADYPDPSLDDNNSESKRICDVINATYFPEVGIKYVSHSNENTKKYYMWQYLSAKTPCVLVEMGQSIDPHDSVLLANTDLIANGLGRAICKAFNVPFDPPVIDTTAEDTAKLKEEITSLKTSLTNLTKRVKDLEGDIVLYKEDIASGTKERGLLVEENQKLVVDLNYYKPYKSRYEAALTNTIDKFTSSQLFSYAWKKFWSERKLSNKK